MASPPYIPLLFADEQRWTNPMILIPVKSFENAKQRLAPVLTTAEPTFLAKAMLQDVLAALARCPSKPQVCVVTGDPYARDLATEHQLHVINDPDNHSETDAIAMAAAICESQGLDFSIVVTGDIPMITPDEVEVVLASAPHEGCVLVPAVDRRGTNAILKRPISLFPLRFANDSFQPHLAAARATGKRVVVLELPGIALDIDRPDDLARFVTGRTSHPKPALVDGMEHCRADRAGQLHWRGSRLSSRRGFDRRIRETGRNPAQRDTTYTTLKLRAESQGLRMAAVNGELTT